MILRARMLLVAAGLLTLSCAVPVTAVMAQQNNPTGNMGSNRSETASPGTADSKAGSGMNTADVGSHSTGGTSYGGTATNRNTPGGTGKTVVPGSNSSQASVSSATREQKSGAMDGGSGAK